jgi:hypothetical protein
MFFAACAGDLGFSMEDISIEEGKLPITCMRDGQRLGADDFVVGYSAVYVYENHTNDNPSIFGLVFDRPPAILPNRATDPTLIFGTSCAGIACLAVPDPTEADIPAMCAQGLCMPACPDDGDIDKCPPHWLGPIVPPDAAVNAEPDTVSQRGQLEQLSVHYHADRGKMRSDVRVIRDGSGAWNPDYAANYYAPKEPGFARIWTVVRDNRGGVDWLSTPLYIQPFE